MSKSKDGPQKGDTIHITMEFGPPKYYGTIPLTARRAISATDDHLEYEKGEYVDKVVVQGEFEVIDTYRKQL